jgi:RNA polymerase sigma factor (sigma-70 family)
MNNGIRSFSLARSYGILKSRWRRRDRRGAAGGDHSAEADLDNVDIFPELMRQVRAGDADAATRLVRLYEPAVRRAVRIWMLNAKLRRTVDSVDICQSVLASFFVRTALSQYQIDTPTQLVNLLVSMARNKLADQLRHEHAGRRDNRRVEAQDVNERELVGVEPTPSQFVANRDLLEEFRRRMSDDERRLAEQRSLGREWADIAAELGGRPDALRKKLDRAVNRIARELGLDDFDHE